MKDEASGHFYSTFDHEGARRLFRTEERAQEYERRLLLPPFSGKILKGDEDKETGDREFAVYSIGHEDQLYGSMEYVRLAWFGEDSGVEIHTVDKGGEEDFFMSDLVARVIARTGKGGSLQTITVTPITNEEFELTRTELGRIADEEEMEEDAFEAIVERERKRLLDSSTLSKMVRHLARSLRLVITEASLDDRFKSLRFELAPEPTQESWEEARWAEFDEMERLYEQE